jgi:hypothetical protein
MNPDPSIAINSDHKLVIIFVHQGKCGGTSIRNAIKKVLPASNCQLLEYHCFDANEKLANVVEHCHDRSNIRFVICTRDPVERLISAYNWALHDKGILSGKAQERHKKWFWKYPTIEIFVQKLLGYSPDSEALISLDKRITHASMGISWYLPFTVASRLPKERTSTIRLEYLKEDLFNCLRWLLLDLDRPMPEAIQIPKEKSEFKRLYAKDSFSDLDRVAYGDIKRLRLTVLREDYLVHDYCMKFVL